MEVLETIIVSVTVLVLGELWKGVLVSHPRSRLFSLHTFITSEIQRVQQDQDYNFLSPNFISIRGFQSFFTFVYHIQVQGFISTTIFSDSCYLLEIHMNPQFVHL